MKKNKLGNSDLNVSKICLGTMTFGEQNTEKEGHYQLDYAVDNDINFIDTAELYPVMPRAETFGETEKIIGSWLKKSNRRKDIILASKVAGPSKMKWIRNGENNFDEKNIRNALEGSLRRLNTEYIDLYQLHWPSRNIPIFGSIFFDPKKERKSEPIESTLLILKKLIDEGKIRYVGVSNESSWGVSEFINQSKKLNLPKIISIQNGYSLTNRHFETGIDETCFRENVSLLAYSPLGFGFLTGKYITNPKSKGRLNHFPENWSPRYFRPLVIEATKKYMQLAKSINVDLAQLALAWCYSRWFIASTIIGATNLDQLKKNVDAMSIQISDELKDEINKIHAEFSNPAQ